MSPGKLAGQVALVTGASRGIGRATAERLGLEGAHVVLNYFARADAAHGNDGAIENALSIVRASGARALGIEADVSDQQTVRAMISAVEAEFGRIDILVNNAGVEEGGTLLETEEAEWDRVLAVNLKGQFLVSQAVVPGMIRRGSGRIVNVSSELALVGRPGASAYVASKAGVIGLTKALARELAPRGILVNCVAPGPTDTDLLGADERGPQKVGAIPLGRIGEPSEIAAAICFLVSPDSSWTTGQVFSPNGGTVI
jgi:3-oxoacyl-[acyl-carrier protein] reductase